MKYVVTYPTNHNDGQAYFDNLAEAQAYAKSQHGYVQGLLNFDEDFVSQIVKFNLQAGLLQSPYSDTLESAFQIEEALEGFGDLPYLAERLAGDSPETIPSPVKARDIARQIVALAEMDTKPTSISEVDRLDKACDAVVFAIGSMAKLGLSVELIHEAVNVVSTCNLQKLGMPKDSAGKLIKPDNFVGPEPLLQAILDKR